MRRVMGCAKLVGLFGVVLCSTAVVRAEALEVSPMSWDYGDVVVGSSETMTFDLKSEGPTAVWLYQILLTLTPDLTGPSANPVAWPPEDQTYSLGAFSFNPLTLGFLPREMPVGEVYPIDMTFTPPSPGYHRAYLFIHSNNSIPPPDPAAFLLLEGTGVPAAVARTLTISSTGGGSVVSPGEGTFQYNDGESVTLQARADSMYTFVGWRGGVFASQNPYSLTMDADYEVKAHFVASQDLLYVDDDAEYDPGPGDSNVSDPRENGMLRHPFDRVQEAIEVAKTGAKVIVRPGTYRETIDLLGKSIEINGLNSDDPNIAALPIIDGQAKDTVVRCTQREDPNCLLTGLVITGGRGNRAGGILCMDSSPSIRNCLIVGNRTTALDGGAGGVWCEDSNAVFAHCTVSGNYGGSQGAGLWFQDSRAVVTNSVVWGNTTPEILAQGSSEPDIAYTDVARGWSGTGNMDADPLFARSGYWADPNDRSKPLAPSDPSAAWVSGDYHLMSPSGRWDPVMGKWVLDAVTSPCVDAGDPLTPVGPEPMPNGDRANLGAYGGTNQASMSP